MCKRCHYLAFEIHFGFSYLIRSGAINFVETLPEGVKSSLPLEKAVDLLRTLT